MIKKEWLFLQGVYKISICEHIYVGSSVNIYKRLGVHLRSLKKNCHDNQYLQRAVNKYGIDKINFEVLEECPTATLAELREREKYWIESIKADLNLKLDPTTEQNCTTTSIKVYQFDLRGNLIKEWPSSAEVARQLHIQETSIGVCCRNPKRQKIAGGYYWSYSSSLDVDIEILYVFDLYGNYINSYTSTVEIYKKFFSNDKQKTVLSFLRKRVNSNIPYKGYYIYNYNNPDFTKIDLEKYQNKFNKTSISENTTVNRYDQQGNLLESKPLSEYPEFVKYKLTKPNSCYSVGENKHFSTKNKEVFVFDISGNFIKKYISTKLAATDLFGFDDSKNICKHLKRGTPYKNYIFSRDA